MFIYYVYAYIRKSDGTPYYIGKGKGRRAFSKHDNIGIPKNKNNIVFLETNLSEIGAFALERRYIRWYGRLSENNGILRNKTEGGDGVSGYKKLPNQIYTQTPESIEKMLTTKKKNGNWNAGSWNSERLKKSWKSRKRNQSPEHIKERLDSRKNNGKNGGWKLSEEAILKRTESRKKNKLLKAKGFLI